MISPGVHILNRFKKRWQLLLWAEIVLYAVGALVLMHFLFFNLLISILTFFLVIGLMAIVLKPWKPNLDNVSSYVDKHIETVAYSSNLLLQPSDRLSGLAKLQQYKIAGDLDEKLRKLQPPTHVKRAIILLILLSGIGVLVYQSGIMERLQRISKPETPKETIIFTATDSTRIVLSPPVLKKQQLTIKYPRYTNLSSKTVSTMDVKAVEGSRLSWQLEFDGEVESVTMESMSNSYPMKLEEGKYQGTSVLSTSGFYNFKFIDNQGNSYVSDLYSIEALKDKSPIVEIKGVKQFTSFEFNQDKNVSFTTSVADDFGVGDAYIIATVSKGSGESVKFREDKLNFDNSISRGSRKLRLSKKLNLDQMDMEPGDELYFYVEAKDQKYPRPNISRSETFFAVIKDTVSNQFAVEGTMGVDLMPDYFRSQRQLIIDTEKLIKDKPKLTTKDFKFKSNELGFDQKALRIKYGAFMGDESEFGPVIEENLDSHTEEEDHEEGDPLAEYTHKHDTENEHNLVPEEEKKEKEDPLGEYLHNHEDPESSTLFTQSLKSKLRQAMSEMWDAELYLRLYKPEQSLPYQYKALKLIQEIKNSARIYVHRIGFDPPPIKEDRRLTGEIDEISNYRKTEELEEVELYPSIKQTVLRLEELIFNKEMITNDDRTLFEQAGNELATKAIENPGKYLKTLQLLKRVTEIEEIRSINLSEIQKGLYKVLPKPKANPTSQSRMTTDINELLLKELEINE